MSGECARHQVGARVATGSNWLQVIAFKVRGLSKTVRFFTEVMLPKIKPQIEILIAEADEVNADFSLRELIEDVETADAGRAYFIRQTGSLSYELTTTERYRFLHLSFPGNGLIRRHF